MNITKHTILPLLALMLTLFTACNDEEAVTMPGTETGDGLHIALSLGGKQPLYAPVPEENTRATKGDSIATRADNTEIGETSLNENTVSTVDFFLFNPAKDANGNIVYDSDGNVTYSTIAFHLRCEPKQDDQKNNSTNNYATEYFTLHNGKDWVTKLGITTTSRLYAIANLDETTSSAIAATNTDGTYTQTFANLKALTFTDADIYKKHTSATTPGTQEVANKLFLMDGYFNSFTTTDLEKPTYQVTVPLRRAAAKVRVNIYKATSWKDANNQEVSIDQDNIEALVKNYATQTKVVAPEDAKDLGETTPEDDYAELSQNNRKNTTGFTEKESINEETCTYLTSVLFYTFAHEWGETESLGEETTFIMNLPYSDGNRPNNWYKIVFVPDGGRSYARNTLYDVDVLVAYDGSEESYEPTPVVNPTYKISEWYPEGFNVENTTPVDYLILDRYYIDMRNVADTTITFYSSNTVTVKVVHDVSAETDFVYPADFPDATSYVGDAIDEAQETLLGMGTNNDIADIPGIYYPDKENRRVPIYTSKEGDNTNNSSNISYNTTNTTNTFTDLNGAVYKPVTVTSYTGGKTNNKYTSDKTNSEVYITWPGDEYSEDGRPINLYSAIPRNATLRFITLKVEMEKKHTPGEYITRYVVIKQYPLEYIVNQFGYYSYMDCGSTGMLSGGNVENKVEYDHTMEKTTKDETNVYYKLYDGYEMDNFGLTKWILVPNEITTTGNLKSGVDGLIGHLSSTGEFKCKFYLDGTDKTHNTFDQDAFEQHQWTDAEGTHIGTIYQIGDQYNDGSKSDKEDNSVGVYANTPSNNNRMYEVRVTATSSKYRIGYPKTLTVTDGNGKTQLYTDPSYENNRLVSPHFVIASQLGNNPATAYWEVARDRCMHYVEVDNQGNVFDNWRLPTIAELSIIKDFQLKPDVYNVTMNRILNSDGEGNPLYWTAGKYEFVHTTGAGKEDNQTFQAQPTGAAGYTFTHNGKSYTTEFQISYDGTEVIPVPVVNKITYYKSKTDNDGNEVRGDVWQESDGVSAIRIKKTVTINRREYKQRDFDLDQKTPFKNPVRVRCVRDIKE